MNKQISFNKQRLQNISIKLKSRQLPRSWKTDYQNHKPKTHATRNHLKQTRDINYLIMMHI